MGVKIVPLTSSTQQTLEAETSSFLTRWLQSGLPTYPGALTPEIPAELGDAFRDFVASSGQYDEEITGAIQDALAGKPAIDFDPTEATALFEETFYTPMMNMFRDIAVPAIRESFNVPGAAFSSGLSRGVSGATESFASQYLVQPFYNLIESERVAARTSAETAEARRLPAAQFATAQPAMQFNEIAGAIMNMLNIQQQPLTAAYQEYLRTQPEAAVGLATPFALTPTNTAFYKGKGSSGFGQIAGMAAGGLASSFGSSFFGGGGGMGDFSGLSPGSWGSITGGTPSGGFIFQ